MQKRESFYVTVVKMPSNGWCPAPRECASLTAINHRAYLMGGLNYDANKEVAQLRVRGLESDTIEETEPEWRNINYESTESI
jgi:hypothetical protein